MQSPYPVLIVGGGMMGLTLAKALADQAINVALIDTQSPLLEWPASDLTARVCALNPAVLNIFQNIGIAAMLNPKAQASFRKLVVWDDAGGGEILFDAANLNQRELGRIIENRDITRALWTSLQHHDHVDLLCPQTPSAITHSADHIEVTLADDQKIRAKLLVAADGAQSWVRQHLKIDTQIRPYHHDAIVAVIETELPHQNNAWQNFQPQGPLGVLPLADPHQAAIVWSITPSRATAFMAQTPDAFNRDITQALNARLGQLTLCSQRQRIPLIMRHAKSYIAPRLALIGDAAHTIHPLAGQGANLGFLDAAALAECIINAMRKSQDIGHPLTLKRYQRARKAQNTLMLMGMRGLKDLFSETATPITQFRSLGLNLLDSRPGLKSRLMHYAMAHQADLPHLAQAKTFD